MNRDPNEPLTPGRPPVETRKRDRIGPYVVLKTLGEGSFGKVKLAVHQVTGQKVALKIISRKKLLSKEMEGRVEREIEFLQLLRHPHIIKLYTVVTTHHDIIMVIEYAGKELFDYIVQNGKVSESGARRFFQQIISAVEYCHRHKVAHRDLKPENLLLDDQLNVKIADFGLSNIMQDGSFLKTSCGSPNYAAPEVINGKLYAGPEVDVWSCGVILYVLLVGRLPFDDEFIPTLFRKIAQGQYTIPGFLSPEAANLLRKMLVVNPLHRITVAEIRQDPWFLKDLPDYLKPPEEEFFNTGVDMNKIATRARTKGNSVEKVADRLHEAVLGKLDKTMGYGKEDVHEALEAKDPNPIKDAYLLARENELLLANPKISETNEMKSFLAQSPPAWTAMPPNSPTAFSLNRPSVSAPSTIPGKHHKGVDSPLSLSLAASVNLIPPSVAAAAPEAASPQNNISILPSSLPEYHRAYMQGQSSNSSLASSLARAKLKPIVSSTDKPAPLTPLPPPVAPPQPNSRKPKPTRWQFGIRSRNLPLEAIACIYKALKRLGAEWVDNSPASPYGDNHDDSDNRSYSSGSEDDDRHWSGDEEDRPRRRRNSRDSRSPSPSGSDESEEREVVPPKDPWIIHVRWKRELKSGGGMEPIYVFITIQLYQLERGFYLVDFRCAGYERVNKASGRSKLQSEEDWVNSPFPFLEIAGGLIIALAEAGE
ncbi:Pkinase-domain-containing protein [Ascobolus immersus RN42]|uniref:non-specific serine/threonine protein kinase n=1 Tax=Ascobolus immersus RN42 TaxID=1160509 RepID=A0A3N4IPX6_ASCIM|nr:Pkinase-domain-containing protein [Ascobolus immersus RN42]